MTSIILIRHAPTVPDKNQHSTDWELSEEAKDLCYKLAQQVKPYQIRKIYTSTESKAQLTGRFVAEKLGIKTIEIAPNLHETERQSQVFYDSQDTFREAVRRAMLSPDELVFGDETFKAAKKRLARQIEQLTKQHANETIAVVSHGRILAMYLASIMKESPVLIWEKLKMPAYAVLSFEENKILDIVYSIEAQ